MPRVTRALIPAAGHGTRLRPLTLAIPKEMLPLGRKPLLEYIIEELAACEISDVLIVISPGKDAIRAYFEDGSRFGVRISYIVQREMKGLGDAILHGEAWAADEPFLAAFGDSMISSPDHAATRRLIDTHVNQDAFASVLTQLVPPERVSRYGILSPSEALPGAAESFPFVRLIEKPNPEDAPSRWAVSARWILNAGIFEYLRRTEPDASGEVGLSQAVDRALVDGKPAWAAPLLPDESRLDIGAWDTYLSAAAEAILQDADYGEGIRGRLCGDITDADAAPHN